MENLSEIKDTIKKLLSNITKSVNKKWTNELIKRKKEELKTLESEWYLVYDKLEKTQDINEQINLINLHIREIVNILNKKESENLLHDNDSEFIETKDKNEEISGKNTELSLNNNPANVEMSLTVHTTISFKDVEYALETFDGTTNQDVLVWIRSFERFALSSKWDEVQKYLFARRLLRKAAKFAVEANDNLGT